MINKHKNKWTCRTWMTGINGAFCRILCQIFKPHNLPRCTDLQVNLKKKKKTLYYHLSLCLLHWRLQKGPDCTSLHENNLPSCCRLTPSPDTDRCCWSTPADSSGSPSRPVRTPSPAARWSNCSSSSRCRAPLPGCSTVSVSAEMYKMFVQFKQISYNQHQVQMLQ